MRGRGLELMLVRREALGGEASVSAGRSCPQLSPGAPLRFTGSLNTPSRPPASFSSRPSTSAHRALSLFPLPCIPLHLKKQCPAPPSLLLPLSPGSPAPRIFFLPQCSVLSSPTSLPPALFFTPTLSRCALAASRPAWTLPTSSPCSCDPFTLSVSPLTCSDCPPCSILRASASGAPPGPFSLGLTPLPHQRLWACLPSPLAAHCPLLSASHAFPPSPLPTPPLPCPDVPPYSLGVLSVYTWTQNPEDTGCPIRSFTLGSPDPLDPSALRTCPPLSKPTFQILPGLFTQESNI